MGYHAVEMIRRILDKSGTDGTTSGDRLCNVPACGKAKYARGICRHHYLLHYRGRMDCSASMTTGLPSGAIDRHKPSNPADLPHYVAAQVARVLGLKVRPDPPPNGVTVITGHDGRTVLVTPECDVVELPPK